jgi:Ca2+-binding RTX toxin-like protein
MTTTIQGTAQNDTLSATSNQTQVFGNAGNDQLSGRGEDILLDGGSGNDDLQLMIVLRGQLMGGEGNDQLSGWGDDLLLDGGAGNDGLQLIAGQRGQLLGGAGSDGLYANSGGALLDGGQGDDRLQGGSSGRDTLIGGQGDDMLMTNGSMASGGANLIRVSLGSGHDTLQRWTGSWADVASPDTIELAADIAPASVQARMSGRDLTLSWNAGQDSLTIQNYVGADLNTVGPFIVRTAAGEVLSFAEALAAARITTSAQGDGVVGSDTTGDTVQAGEGNDTLYGRGGNDRLEGQLGQDFIDGGDGHDTLLGGWDIDTLIGGLGNDWLLGGQGADELNGNEGDDTLQGGAGGDVLQGGLGRNVLDGGAGNDTLFGAIGSRNTYIAGSGNDHLVVDDNEDNTFVMGRHGGNDTSQSANGTFIRGGAQTVRLVDGIRPDEVGIRMSNGSARIELLDGSSSLDLYLGAGRIDSISFDDGTRWDTAAVAAHVVVALPTAGPDALSTTRTDVPLQGGAGNDTLSGQGAVTLDGGAGNDILRIGGAFGAVAPGVTLIGGSGDDQLEGASGADTLYSGAGDDRLLGGDGLDTYVFNRGDGRDSIEEFSWCFSATPQALETAVAVRMGPGISADQLSFVRQGDQLTIKLNGTDDQLAIQNYFFGQVTGSIITLADGSTISPEAITQKLITENPSTPPAPITTSGNDTIDLTHSKGWGSFGGGAGSDTYLWSGRTNAVSIVDQSEPSGPGTDVLQLGAGITPDQVHLNYNFGGASSQGWVLTADERSGSVMAQGRMPNTAISDLPLIRFADGQTWDQATITAKLLASAPESMRTWAQGGNDTLRTQDAATSRALGGAGSDTYIVGLSNQISRIGSASDKPWWTTEGVNQLFTNVAAPSANDVDTLRFTDGIRPQDLRAVQFDDGTGNLALLVRGTDVRVDINRFLQDTSNASSEVDRVVFDDGTVWGRSDLSLLASRLHADGLSQQGGVGNNRITGEDGHDWLGGSNGRDTLDGGAGRDTLVGGAGNDSYVVDDIGDVVVEQANGGRDQVQASIDYAAPDNVEIVLLSGNANLQARGRATQGTGLIGNQGNNLLTGGTGSDTLAGGSGLDTLIGGAGGDFYRITEEQTQVIEQASDDGIDAISSFTEHLTMADHVEYLFLATDSAYAADGNAQENWMFGRASGSWLDGHAGDDHLTGGSGEDMLIGGAGDDELSGAAGNDHYTHASGDGFDVITDVDSRAGNVDTLDWQGVSAQQLWFSHVGNDLQIQVLGSTEGVRVANWFQGSANQIEHLTVGSQTLGNDRVAALVQVMASMSPPASSISSLGSADQARLQTALSAAWQG